MLTLMFIASGVVSGFSLVVILAVFVSQGWTSCDKK